MSDGYLGNERLKRVGVELSFTEEQLKDIILCTQDPVYFITNYVKIVNIDKGLVPFNMWDFKKKWFVIFIRIVFLFVKCLAKLVKLPPQ